VWDYDSNIGTQEITLLKQKIKEAFADKIKIAFETDKKPDWFNDYHFKYDRKRPLSLKGKGEHAVDEIVFIHYERSIIYGLPGDKPFFAYIPGGPIQTINMTDDDPDWIHQSQVSIDVYNVLTGKRHFTYIKMEESPSLNSYDQEEFDDNIESISEDVNENFFTSLKQNYFTERFPETTVRDPVTVRQVIKDYLVWLLMRECGSGCREASIKMSVDEWGNVFNVSISGPGSSIEEIVKKFASTAKITRVTVPNDTAVFTMSFQPNDFRGLKMINGYYVDITGSREPNEVWRILNRHIDTLVQATRIKDNGAEEFLEIKFAINNSGLVENLKIVNSTELITKHLKKLSKKINGWEFGNKGDEKDSGTTVECIFNFKKNKIELKGQ
jgi:hypothetical protein